MTSPIIGTIHPGFHGFVLACDVWLLLLKPWNHAGQNWLTDGAWFIIPSLVFDHRWRWRCNSGFCYEKYCNNNTSAVWFVYLSRTWDFLAIVVELSWDAGHSLAALSSWFINCKCQQVQEMPVCGQFFCRLDSELWNQKCQHLVK